MRAHRTRRGWTQVDLGAKIGYSGSYVSDVERGDKGATDDFAKRCDSEDAFDLPGTFLRLWEDLQRESFPTWFAPVVPIERESVKISGWASLSQSRNLPVPAADITVLNVAAEAARGWTAPRVGT